MADRPDRALSAEAGAGGAPAVPGAGGLRLLANGSLRGVGQVLFQDNRLSALLFLAGLAVAAPLAAAATVLGSFVGTAFAQWLQADRAALRSGLFGFNGALVALALALFLRPSPLAWACVVLAAALSSIVTAAMTRWLARHELPALTAPFVLTTLCVFLATAHFGRLPTTAIMPTASLPQAATVEGVVTAATLLDASVRGIGQVFFQDHRLAGALIAAGLLLASRAAFFAAVTGAVLGALVAWVMGAPEPDIRAGLYGFNSVLVAVALSSALRPCTVRNFAWAVLAAAVTPFTYAAITAAFAPLGVPALTLPFVLVTWLFLLALRQIPANVDGPTSA